MSKNRQGLKRVFAHNKRLSKNGLENFMKLFLINKVVLFQHYIY